MSSSRLYNNIIMSMAVSAALIAGCLEPPVPVAFEQVASGQHGPDRSLYEVAVGEQLIDPAPGDAWMKQLLPAQPGRDILIFTTAGQQTTAGHSISITDITRRRHIITVTVTLQRPQPGEHVAQVMTAPYAVTRIPRSELPPGRYQVQFSDHRGRSLAIRQLNIQ